MDGVEQADGLSGSVLIIGFGRFGQVASQTLLARGVDVTIIDIDVEMIQAAARLRLQGLLRRRHAPRRAARLRRRIGRGRSSSASTSDVAPMHRRAREAPSSRSAKPLVARLRPRALRCELIAAGVDPDPRDARVGADPRRRSALELLGWQPHQAGTWRFALRRHNVAQLAGWRRIAKTRPAADPPSSPSRAASSSEELFALERRQAAQRQAEPAGAPAAGTAGRRIASGLGLRRPQTMRQASSNDSRGLRANSFDGSPWPRYADEVGLDLGAGPERGVDLGVVEAAHRPAIEAERARREDEVAALQAPSCETRWCRRTPLLAEEPRARVGMGKELRQLVVERHVHADDRRHRCPRGSSRRCRARRIRRASPWLRAK